MAFDEKITEIMRNIGIAENTLMAVQLELDAYEARATAAEAKVAVLLPVLDALIQHEASSFFGPEGEKHKRASYRGVIRKAKKARAALETDNG